MNILIVGNGFDLSHYLPTKYDHFMVTMDAIEKWDILKGDMGFDDLFEKDYFFKNEETGEEWQNSFFQHTKEMYKTDEIKISVDQIKVLKEQLKDNVWYQYFSDHVREVKTWIDFEQQISELLLVLTKTIPVINEINLSKKVSIHRTKLVSQIGERSFDILNFFNVFDKAATYCSYNSKFCYAKNQENGFNISGFIEFIYIQLEDFIKLFNSYLVLIVDELNHKDEFSIVKENWKIPDKIYSFNYTNSYHKFYKEISIDFLHGKLGKQQNIVLGISDLEESLSKLKAFGFTKYHQKLFKDTDYLFLDKKVSKVKLYKNNFSDYKRDYGHQSIQQFNETISRLESLDLNIEVWGHSLDVSDQDYIKDLFSLNDDIDRNVRVTVYYFDSNAKFSLLNNLLGILKKDKVEHWMKNGWLKFEENPKINFGI